MPTGRALTALARTILLRSLFRRGMMLAMVRRRRRRPPALQLLKVAVFTAAPNRTRWIAHPLAPSVTPILAGNPASTTGRHLAARMGGCAYVATCVLGRDTGAHRQRRRSLARRGWTVRLMGGRASPASAVVDGPWAVAAAAHLARDRVAARRPCGSVRASLQGATVGHHPSPDARARLSLWSSVAVADGTGRVRCFFFAHRRGVTNLREILGLPIIFVSVGVLWRVASLFEQHAAFEFSMRALQLDG